MNLNLFNKEVSGGGGHGPPQATHSADLARFLEGLAGTCGAETTGSGLERAEGRQVSLRPYMPRWSPKCP